MRNPDVATHASAFDALLEATPEGGVVDYRLPLPKWWFLHHLVRSGWVLHGTNAPEIDEFRTKENFDAHNVRRVEGVWAADDAIWPIYFAVVNRSVAQSYINWCEHVRGKSRYLFSIGSDPRRAESWTDGTVYVLDAGPFEPTPGSRELVSRVPVRPRARVRVSPADFPFREQTIGHRRGESVRRVALRNALRVSSRRPR